LVRVSAFLILRPIAYLPRRPAFAAADAIGFLYSLSPMGARVRRSMSIAFPSGDAAALAREWMTRPFRDYVSMSRILARRDNVGLRPIESRGAPALLREPGQSVIVATGHFSREPMECLYAACVIPKKLATVVAALDRSSLKPRALRLRVQFGMMVDAIRAIREGDVEILHVGRPGLVTRMVKHLKQPDTVVIISSDAVLAGGREVGLHRPFAGHAMVDFALGTARLSRLSQRPIVVCVPFLDTEGRTVLDWSDPIPAPARDDESADDRVTNAVVDFLERAVGLRPGQYVLPIGDQRRWSETAMCWVDPPELGSTPKTRSARPADAPLS
jgi:lauroyl/myristoyl acyltransferase